MRAGWKSPLLQVSLAGRTPIVACIYFEVSVQLDCALEAVHFARGLRYEHHVEHNSTRSRQDAEMGKMR